MIRTFFFQQNVTKINDFDEGVLILEPLFWGNVIFKICSFCIKSHIWGREEFLWVGPPDCKAAKLRNECFSLFTLALLYKARADTLPGEAKQLNIFGTLIVTFEIEGQILKITLPQKSGHRIKTSSSKLTILVSSCWEKNFIRNNVHNFFILSLVFLKLLIVSVAFFLGHPVYVYWWALPVWACLPKLQANNLKISWDFDPDDTSELLMSTLINILRFGSRWKNQDLIPLISICANGQIVIISGKISH